MTAANFTFAVGTEVETTNNSVMLVGIVGALINTTGQFFPLQGALNSSLAEFKIRTKIYETSTITFLRAIVATNTMTAVSTLIFRKGGANGNNTLSITSATTGAFEDTTSVDSLISGDLVNLQISSTGTGAGTFSWSMLYTGPSSGTVINSNFLSFM